MFSLEAYVLAIWKQHVQLSQANLQLQVFFFGWGEVFILWVYLDDIFPESSRTTFCVSNTKVRVLVVRHIEEDALDPLSEKIGLPSRLVVNFWNR